MLDKAPNGRVVPSRSWLELGLVVSGVINLESSGVEASDWRLRHEQAYHEA